MSRLVGSVGAMGNHQSEPAPGETALTVEESVALLRELVSLWRENPPTTIPVFENTALRGVGALSHVDHAMTLTNAVTLLAENEMFVQLIPLVRMTLECAVTAAWFATARGSGDAALLEGTRLRRALASDAARLIDVDSREAIADLNVAMGELGAVDSAEAKKFEARCRSLVGGDWLYLSYRHLSEFSHAGSLLLDHYIQSSEVSEATPLGFEYVPEDDPVAGRNVLGLDCWLVHIALSSWDSLAPTPVVTKALAEIGNKMDFQSALVRRLPGPCL